MTVNRSNFEKPESDPLDEPIDFEPEKDRSEQHAFGCICADCSDAELTADND